MLKTFVLVDDTDVLCEYDCDDEDQSWLDNWAREHSKTSLSVEKFEQSMEFLEKNFKNRVPTLEMLIAKKITKRPEAEDVYDYWQTKRLKNGKSLIPQVKSWKKLGAYDPYVAFRPWEERMKTRKNKLADRAKFLKLLKIRSWLGNDLQDCLHKKNKAIQDHKSLVHKLEEFSAQNKIRSFNDEFLTWTRWPHADTEVEEICGRVEEPSEDEYEEENLTDVKYPFIPKPGSDYLMAIESNIPDDDKGFFQIRQGGLFRRRIGRGARIILDRKAGRHDCMKDSFRSVNINPIVLCSKLRFMPHVKTKSTQRSISCSEFRLESTRRDENIEYNKAEFV